MKDEQERELLDENLLQATIRLNIILFAISGFVFGGFTLMLVTYFATPYPEHMLNLLTLFLPGYTISATGAWYGLFWGGTICSLASVVCYKIYSKTIGANVLAFIESGKKIEDLEMTHLPMNGNILGLILGAFGSILLFSTTLYLSSIGHSAGRHIELLANWLPYYDLTTMGGALGSISLFIEVYLIINVVAIIYNKMIAKKSGATS